MSENKKVSLAEMLEEHYDKVVEYKGLAMSLSVSRYADNERIALLLKEPDGQLYTVCSSNLPAEEMAEDEVAIKSYSENEGILDMLIQNNVVSHPVRYAHSGHVELPICKFFYQNDLKS